MNIQEIPTSELLSELNRRLPKEKIKAYLEKRKEMKAVFKEVLENIANAKVEEPKFHFKFLDNPKDFDVKTLMEWYEAIELYYHFAKRWEEQERGSALSVDRAYHRYLKPKCQELLDFLRKGYYSKNEIIRELKMAYEGLSEEAKSQLDIISWIEENL